jgi:restriction system protein
MSKNDNVTYVFINDSNDHFRNNHERNKWVAFFLCLFLGFFGVHKFYERKILLGLLYLFTGGLFSIGWFIDCIVLFFKPNPYYV